MCNNRSDVKMIVTRQRLIFCTPHCAVPVHRMVLDIQVNHPLCSVCSALFSPFISVALDSVFEAVLVALRWKWSLCWPGPWSCLFGLANEHCVHHWISCAHFLILMLQRVSLSLMFSACMHASLTHADSYSQKHMRSVSASHNCSEGAWAQTKSVTLYSTATY